MNLTLEHAKSIGKGALMAGAGAMLAFLLAWATSADGTASLGVAGPFIGAALSVLVNTTYKAATAAPAKPVA